MESNFSELDLPQALIASASIDKAKEVVKCLFNELLVFLMQQIDPIN